MFFKHLQAYLQQNPEINRELERYSQFQKHGAELNRKKLYSSLLDRVFPLFGVAFTPVSKYAELRPVYEIIDQLNPHYFRSDQIREKLHSIPSLSQSQQSQLCAVIKHFLEEIKRTILNPQEMASLKALQAWCVLMPESDTWGICSWLESEGIWTCSSYSGFCAWSRFTLGELPEAETTPVTWFKHCAESENAEGAALFANTQASAFSGELSHLGIPGYCGSIPQCEACPLQNDCLWFKKPPSSDSIEDLIQNQTLERIPLTELLAVLFETPVADLKLLEPYLHSGSALRNMEAKIRELGKTNTDTSVPQKINLLLEVCRRYGEERMTPGKLFRHSSDVFQHFHHRLRTLKQEEFIIVLLDNKHRYLNDQVITKGILNRSLVHPREVFGSAIESRAAAIICVHNHPSGDPQPSAEDVKITQRLKEVGSVVGIPVLDHIIIGDQRYTSLSDEGLL